jgi:predicted HicB family RNase H-like nuclease
MTKDLIKYKGYYGSVNTDNDELIFFGKICFIKASISYDSTNAKGLKKAFQEAVNDYLEMCHRENIMPETSVISKKL